MCTKQGKIFLVNLRSSAERRKIMKAQLDKHALEFELFDAVKGSDLSQQNILRYYDADYYAKRPSYYTAGMVGCTLSHFFLYQKIVAEKISVALVLEDDMALTDELAGMLPDLYNAVRPDEVILLFYQSYFPIRLSSVSAKDLSGRHKLYQVADIGALRSTGAYLITYEAAKSFVDQLLPISTFPDAWRVFYERKILNGIRLVYPFLLNNTYEATTIKPDTRSNILKRSLAFIEKNKIPPFNQLMKWRRKINIANTRKCIVVNEPAKDLRSPANHIYQQPK